MGVALRRRRWAGFLREYVILLGFLSGFSMAIGSTSRQRSGRVRERPWRQPSGWQGSARFFSSSPPCSSRTRCGRRTAAAVWWGSRGSVRIPGRPSPLHAPLGGSRVRRHIGVAVHRGGGEADLPLMRPPVTPGPGSLPGSRPVNGGMVSLPTLIRSGPSAAYLAMFSG